MSIRATESRIRHLLLVAERNGFGIRALGHPVVQKAEAESRTIISQPFEQELGHPFVGFDAMSKKVLNGFEPSAFKTALPAPLDGFLGGRDHEVHEQGVNVMSVGFVAHMLHLADHVAGRDVFFISRVVSQHATILDIRRFEKAAQ